MVGGVVVEACEVSGEPDLLYLEVADYPHKGAKIPDRCSVRVSKNADSERIQIGDSVWWQNGKVYWTPQDVRLLSHVERAKRGLACGVDWDVSIPKVGYSGAVRDGKGT